MARDETARDPDEPRSLLDRRSYLRLAGAAAVSVGAAGAYSSSADAASYDTVTVPSNTTKVFRLDSGDTLENTLIDITADGAEYRIYASGDGWTVRNVGVRGYFDTGDKLSPFVVECPNGGTGTVENVYLGDGGGGKSTGIFVHADHSGHVSIGRLNVQGWPDNGVYASGPGNSSSHSVPGGGGTIEIADSYGASNGTSNFRIGTTGSQCRNCVAVGGDRGFWGYYEETSYVNCDSSGAGEQFRAGAYAWEKSKRAVVTLQDCRASGTLNWGPGTVEGSPASGPRTSPPSGVPTTPEEAASGSSTSGSDSTTTTDPGSSSDSGTLLELVAGSNTSNVSYEFTVEGSVSKRTSGGDVTAEANDSVTDNGDGTVTVSGVSGNGYGDAFYVDGIVTSMTLDESKWTIRYGGSEVSVSDVALPNTLVIDGTDTPQRSSDYTFTVTGTAQKSAALGSVNDYDSISGGEISGRVIGGKDGYRFSGEITGFSLDGPATVRVEDGS